MPQAQIDSLARRMLHTSIMGQVFDIASYRGRAIGFRDLTPSERAAIWRNAEATAAMLRWEIAHPDTLSFTFERVA